MRKKKDRFVNPMHMTNALKEFGESLDKKSAFIFYGAMFLLALYLGIFFELKPVCIAVVIAVYVLCTPQLIYNQKKHAFEARRFQDVNAYMSQMAQTFTDTQDIISSLKRTSRSFSVGRMEETLREALSIIDNGTYDIRQSERDALSYIESRYDCEKIRNLHNFILSAEELGGECTTEFAILEKIRGAWKDAVTLYYRQLVNKRNFGLIIYGILLLLCIFMLNVLRDAEIDIIGMGIIQLANTAMISLFIVFFVTLDRKLNVSLLKDARVMSEEKAAKAFAYVNGFDSKKERHKNIVYAVSSVIAAVLIVIGNRTMISVAIASGIIFLGFNVHKITLILTIDELKSEVRKAFPMWLFDVMLLIQRESVEGAIEKSIDTAQPVLKNELQRICGILRAEPHNPDAYTSFFADYNNLDIEEAMRKLYALSIGNGGNGDVMSVIIESNLVILEQAEKERLHIKGSINISGMVPILIVGGGFLMYIVGMFIEVINGLSQMF